MKRFKTFELIKYLFFVFLAVALNGLIIAQSNPPPPTESFNRPWFGQFQYAGNMGQFSLGAGRYFFRDNFLLSLHYGRTPSTHEEGSTIHSYTLKNTFIPVRILLSDKYYAAPEIGWAISYSGYSPLPLLMFGGLRVEREFDRSTISAIGLFFQIGTNSMWLNFAADNEDVGIEYLYNLSTGIQVNF